MSREQLSKKTRFEVFKRDSFTCQYCGESAPNVVLHVDHIKPVSDGGENELFNLITSCANCNLGKGARELSDYAVIEKQKKQLDELNDKRNQLEMLLEWKESLRDIEERQIEALQNLLSGWEFCANETAEKKLRRWINKYSFEEVYEAIEESFDRCIQYNNGQVTSESWNKAFKTVPRILKIRQEGGDPEEDMKLHYIRGILRNRVYVNEKMIMSLLRDAKALGADMNKVQELAKTCRNWTIFRETLEDFIEENGGAQ